VRKLFLLSPAKANGARALLLLNPAAPFPLARQFREEGLPLAEIFSFASGLYFRGKIAYARRFADDAASIRVITSNAGLLPADQRLSPADVRAFGTVDIDEKNHDYLAPLQRDARTLRERLGPDGCAVLLGSIATGKYRDALLEVFEEQLLFPRDFVGRGDMSRGALLLRHAGSGEELVYASVKGAVYSGRRAPRIAEM
jgi:hypothetical protein